MIPLWMIRALAELERGVHELPDPQENPRIVEYHAATGTAPDDEIPWCASFVGWCLDNAGMRGLKGTGKPNARSYLEWGLPSKPKFGAIAVLWRGSPTGWQGHVGFVLDASDDLIYLLGGNQRDRVSIAAFPITRALGFRWPALAT